jgi:hypothetical protein
MKNKKAAITRLNGNSYKIILNLTDGELYALRNALEHHNTPASIDVLMYINNVMNSQLN